jgi:hypothetical protein
VIAGLRSGLVSFSCEKCQTSPYVKDNLGCEKPTQVPARWFEDDEEWFNCPMQFIPRSCYEFVEKYDAYKGQIASPPDFENQAAKFNAGVKAYEYYLGKFMAQKQGQ